MKYENIMTAWQDDYLRLRESGMLEAQALRALKVSRRALRELRTVDQDFAEREYEIEQEQIDLLEIEAIKRATEGAPVYSKEGQHVGNKPSDTLLMFLLKGQRREKYGDKTEIKQDSELVVQIRDIAAENNVDVKTAKRLALSAVLDDAPAISYGEF